MGRSRWLRWRFWGVLSVLLGALPAEGQTASGQALGIVGGTLWDGTADNARPNPGILVRNGTIVWMAPGQPTAPESPTLPEGTDLVELSDDAFIMPGLFDLHAHYAVDLFGEGRVDDYTVNPVLFLANGVTSTFPAGEVDSEEARLGRARIARGEIPGPRIYASGPYWGSARPGWDHEAMTADSIRKEATFWALSGVRGFKAKGIRPDQLRVVIDVAHQHGVTVTGHLDSGFRGSVNPRDAIHMGIDRVEHFLGGDALPGSQSAYASLEALALDDPETSEKIRAQAELFVERGAFFDATLTAYGYFADREPAVFDYWADEMGFLTPYARQAVEDRLPRRPLDQFERIYYVKRGTVKAFVDAGGADHLTLGTDHPSWGEFWSGFGAHRELHAMVLAGVPNAVALRAGTANAARALGVAHRLGTVEVGKYADLLIVRGNPLVEITDTRNAMLVIKAGRVYDPAVLFESVRGTMGPSGPTDADWWKGSLRLGR
jgi:imidazolonepropionase-like amidohydrolase